METDQGHVHIGIWQGNGLREVTGDMKAALTGRLLLVVTKILILPFPLLLDFRGGYGRIIALLAWDLLGVRHKVGQRNGGVGGDRRWERRKPSVGLLLAERRRRGQRRGAGGGESQVCQLRRAESKLFIFGGTKFEKGLNKQEQISLPSVPP